MAQNQIQAAPPPVRERIFAPTQKEKHSRKNGFPQNFDGAMPSTTVAPVAVGRDALQFVQGNPHTVAEHIAARCSKVSAICRRKICGTIEKVSESLSGSLRCVGPTRSRHRHERDRFESELYQPAKQCRKRYRTFGIRS